MSMGFSGISTNCTSMAVNWTTTWWLCRATELLTEALFVWFTGTIRRTSRKVLPARHGVMNNCEPRQSFGQSINFNRVAVFICKSFSLFVFSFAFSYAKSFASHQRRTCFCSTNCVCLFILFLLFLFLVRFTERDRIIIFKWLIEVNGFMAFAEISRWWWSRGLLDRKQALCRSSLRCGVPFPDFYFSIV